MTLLSLNRSLDNRLQFLGICGGGENGAVAVDEVHGTARVVGSVLAPHTVLVVQFQQTRPGVAITFHGLLHSIGLLLASDGNDGEALVLIFLIDGNHGNAMPAAGAAPRCPEVDEGDLAFRERGNRHELAVGVAHRVVDVGLARL